MNTFNILFSLIMMIGLLHLMYSLMQYRRARFFRNAANNYRLVGLYRAASAEGGIPSEQIEKDAERAGKWLTYNKTSIKARMKEAGIDEPISSIKKFINGRAHEDRYPLISFPHEGAAEQMMLRISTMREAQGHHVTKAVEALNPLTWVESLWNIPLILGRGVEVEDVNNVTVRMSWAIKIAWRMVIVVGTLHAAYIAYSDINAFLIGFIGKA